MTQPDTADRYLWRVPAQSTNELRESDYAASVWEREGAKPTILFPRQRD